MSKAAVHSGHALLLVWEQLNSIGKFTKGVASDFICENKIKTKQKESLLERKQHQSQMGMLWWLLFICKISFPTWFPVVRPLLPSTQQSALISFSKRFLFCFVFQETGCIIPWKYLSMTCSLPGYCLFNCIVHVSHEITFLSYIFIFYVFIYF